MRPRSYAPSVETRRSQDSRESWESWDSESTAESTDTRARRTTTTTVVHKHYFMPAPRCQEGFPPWYIFGGPLCPIRGYCGPIIYS